MTDDYETFFDTHCDSCTQSPVSYADSAFYLDELSERRWQFSKESQDAQPRCACTALLRWFSLYYSLDRQRQAFAVSHRCCQA